MLCRTGSLTKDFREQHIATAWAILTKVDIVANVQYNDDEYAIACGVTVVAVGSGWCDTLDTGYYLQDQVYT